MDSAQESCLITECHIIKKSSIQYIEHFLEKYEGSSVIMIYVYITGRSNFIKTYCGLKIDDINLLKEVKEDLHYELVSWINNTFEAVNFDISTIFSKLVNLRKGTLCE